MTLNTDRLSKATSRRETMNSMATGVQNNIPKVESGNLFNQTPQPSLNGFSETVQPSVSSDVFSGTTIPSKDTYNYAKSVGGSMLEEQQQTIKNTFANLINETYSNINQGISNAVDLFSGIKQNFGGGITTTFSKSAQNLLQEGAYVSQIGNKLEQGIAKRLGTEDDVARVKKEGEEGYETVKGWANKASKFLEEAQKGYWGDTLLQGEGAKGYVNELSYQLGQMSPSIAAGLLGGKTATFLTLLPFMSQEAYDRYSNIEGVSDTQVFLASNIVGILNSLVETVFGLENLASGGRKITPKFLKKPVLNYLSKFGVEYGVNITGETLEEVIQAINEDIGAFLLGEESEFESVWDMLTSSSYWKNMYGETIVPTAKISAGLLGLPTHISTMHEIKKEQTIDKVLEDLDKGITENLENVDKQVTDINKTMEDIFTRDSMLYDLAQEEETYEEFLEDAKEYADEEKLNNIWNTVKGTPKVETSVSEIEGLEDLEDLEIQEEDEGYMESVSQSAQQTQQTQTERDMNGITEFINQAEEHFNQRLAQEQNRTLEEVRKQQQELKEFELTESQTSKINNALFNLALTVDTKTLREAGLKDNVPNIVDGRYTRPKILDSIKQGTVGEGVKEDASRKETESQYYKTIDQLDLARRQRNTLITLINSLNKTLDTNRIDDAINMVDKAVDGKLIGKDILLSDLKNGNIVNASFKARAMVNDWNKVIKKLKAKADREAWKYIYRLHSESKDNQLIGFSTFSLKHKLKTKPTDVKYINMIQGALKNMSELFDLDMSKVFEGCHVIFLDYGGSSSKQSWGSMEGFVDGNGTPVIPISLNYVGWKESTVIHELIHGLDFVYQYRNGGVSFVENASRLYSANFLYTLNSEFPDLYKKLLKGLTFGEGRKGYWTKPTEVMSRIFQEYYEYYQLKQTNTVNDTWHWKNISLVKEAVNKLTDLFREEFGRNPVINGTETVEEYNRKIDRMVEKFNSENTWKFLEMIEKVGLDRKATEDKLIELGDKLKGGDIDWNTYIEKAGELNKEQQEIINEKIGLRKERVGKAGEQMKGLREKTDVSQSVEEVIRYAVMLSDLEFQWDMLMDLGQEFTDVMLGTRSELTDLGIEAEKYNAIVQEAREYVEEFDMANKLEEKQKKFNNRIEEIKEELIKRYSDTLVGKGKTKKRIEGEMKRIANVFARTSDRLLQISPRIGAALQEMEVMSGINTAKYGRYARDFFKKFKKLSKAQQDEFHQLVIDFGDETADTVLGREKLLAFVDKYGLREERDDVSDMLKVIRDEAIAAGLKVADKENYFPRNVKDYDGLNDYLNKIIQEGKGDIDYKPELELLGRLQGYVADEKLTPEEKQRRIRNVLIDLSGRFNKKVSTRSSHQKKRSITGTKDWGEGLLKFYDTPDVALAKYIEDMVSRIERAKFFGMGVEAEGIKSIYDEVKSLGLKVNDKLREDIRLYILGEKDSITNIVTDIVEQGRDYDSAVEISLQLLEKINSVYEKDTDTSITGVLNKGIKEGWLTPDNLDETRELLKSYFAAKATIGGAAVSQSLISAIFLSDVRNTLTQVADIGFTIAQGGLIKPAVDAMLNRIGINVDVLGIEDPREELKATNAVGKATSKLLQSTGFKTFDMAFKNTFLNQTFNTMCKQAKSIWKWKQNILKARLRMLWGEDKGDKIFNIYKEGRLPTEDGKLILSEAMPVLVDCACELGNTQPIYKSSRTKYYNDNTGYGRTLYSLKTYTLSLLNQWYYGTRRKFRYAREAGYGVAASGAYAAKFVTFNMAILTICEVFAGELKNLWDTIPYWLYQLTGKGDDDEEQRKETVLYTWLNKGSKEAGELIWDNFKEQLLSMFLFNKYSKTAWNIYGAKGVIMEQLPPILETVTEAAQIIGWTINKIAGKNIFADVQHPTTWSRRVPGVGSLIYQSWGKEYAKEHKDVEKTKKEKDKGKTSKYSLGL